MTATQQQIEEALHDEIIRQSTATPGEYSVYIGDDDQEAGTIELDGPVDLRALAKVIMGYI